MHAARNVCSTDSNWTHSGLPLHAWMQMVQTSHPSPFCIGMTELLGRVPRSLYSHSRVGQRSANSMTTSNPSAERKSDRQRGEVARRWLTAFIVFPVDSRAPDRPTGARRRALTASRLAGAGVWNTQQPQHATARVHGVVNNKSFIFTSSFGMFKTWITKVRMNLHEKLSMDARGRGPGEPRAGAEGAPVERTRTRRRATHSAEGGG